MVDYELNYEGILSVFCILFGIADLTRPQLPKCNNHLVSFIKVDGLSVSYIVDIFDIIKIKNDGLALHIVDDILDFYTSQRLI